MEFRQTSDGVMFYISLYDTVKQTKIQRFWVDHERFIPTDFRHFKCQPHNMVKHTQIRRIVWVCDHFVWLVLIGLVFVTSCGFCFRGIVDLVIWEKEGHNEKCHNASYLSSEVFRTNYPNLFLVNWSSCWCKESVGTRSPTATSASPWYVKTETGRRYVYLSRSNFKANKKIFIRARFQLTRGSRIFKSNCASVKLFF